MTIKEVAKKLIAFVRNNTSFSTIILIIIVLTGLYYRHQIFQAGKEMGTGTIRSLQGFPVKDMADVQRAVKENKKFTYIESDEGDSILVATSKPIPEVEKEKNPLKVIAITNLKEVGEGIAWQVLEVGIVNADLTLTTIGAGVGVSKDITKNAFIGGGVICDYQVKDFKSISDHTSLAIYGGFRF